MRVRCSYVHSDIRGHSRWCDAVLVGFGWQQVPVFPVLAKSLNYFDISQRLLSLPAREICIKTWLHAPTEDR
jgi:hypothetical protein